MASTTQQCPACNSSFNCHASDEPSSCWCQHYPAIIEAAGKDDECLCPNCLGKLLNTRLSDYTNNMPIDQAIAVARQYNNNRPLTEHIDYAMESGNLVFTRWYHLKRGSCCGNGCRHCPYN